jgi:hypothetical protein
MQCHHVVFDETEVSPFEVNQKSIDFVYTCIDDQLDDRLDCHFETVYACNCQVEAVLIAFSHQIQNA